MTPQLYRAALIVGLASSAALRAAAQEHQHPPSQPTTSRAAVATPLYDNLGSLHYAITTASPVAQQYFDQGLRLTYGFNHDEAIKSFREGIRHDSTCAMCYWGVAYALGPNINLPMDTSAARPAYDAAQKALKYASKTTPREQALIQALATRYSVTGSANRAPLDSAWAKAIGAVWQRFPADDDVAALYAEALMDLRPWNYWTNGGRPKAPSTLEALRALEPVVKRNPGHPGACHYYIHAIEASSDAAKALPCAERLGTAMPGAGHLVHMPTHIYIRLGKWDIAADRNVHAVHADERFISERQPTGVYPMAYYPHNYHMMWYALNMLGRSDDALKAARGVVKNVPAEAVRQAPPLEYFSPTVLFTLARFSRWDEILRQPAPPRICGTPPAYGTTCAAWRLPGRESSIRRRRSGTSCRHRQGHASRGLRQPELRAVTAGHRGESPAGEMAAKQGQTDEAVKHLTLAIAGEDELTYDEPPPWYLPIRQRLGAILLEARRPAEAEKAFREDLMRRPENGWSLRGLAQSLQAQERTSEAQRWSRDSRRRGRRRM